MSTEPLEVIAGAPDRPLVIGDIEIPCYVLEDETRVLSQRGVTAGIGLNPDAGFRMPQFMASRSIARYVSADSMPALKHPVRFKNPVGGGIALGYPATLLPDICDVILAARAAGSLQERQLPIAQRCELLIRGLAQVGIIALVDEATGYQDIRAQLALAKILEEFISQGTPAVDQDLPLRILHGDCPSERVASDIQHKASVSDWSLYERYCLRPHCPGLLEELRNVNPTLPTGRRQHRHHQWFTPEFGHPKLKEHLAAVTALMRAAPNWPAFQRSLQRAFRKLNDNLPLPIED